VPLAAEEQAPYLVEDLPGQINRLKKEMKSAAKKLEFEKAAALRDRIKELETTGLKFGGKVA
jgi:excinuclease ABC subunit B